MALGIGGGVAGVLIVKVMASLTGLDRGLAQAGMRLNAFSGRVASGQKSAMKAGLALTKFATVPIIGGFALAAKMAGDFEKEMNVLQAVTHGTGKQMKEAGKLARDLGRDVKLPGVSAKDAAVAMTTLSKGGLNLDQSMHAVKGSLMLATAAQTDFKTAADINANAINMFSLKASDAGMVADLLAGAANAASGEITDMALGLQMSGSVAKMANQNIQDTVTAISLMAKAGIRGSDAGTSLKTMMLRMIAPTGKAKGLIKEFGIATRDAAGEVLPMRQLIQNFTGAMQKLSPAQRDMAMNTIFGTDAIRSSFLVLSKGTPQWDAMRAKVTQAGEAQRMAAAQTAGFNGKLDAFKSAAEGAAITIGTMLLPAFSSILTGMTNMVNAIEGAPGPIKAVGIAMLTVIAAAGPLLILTKALSPAIKLLAFSFKGLSVAIMFLVANPLVAVLLAIGVALVIAWQRSEKFRIAVKAAFMAVTAEAKIMAAFIQNKVVPAFNAIIGPVRSALGILVSLVKFNINVIATIIGTVAGIVMKIVSAFRAILGPVAGAVSTLAGIIRRIVTTVAGIVGATLSAALRVGKAIVTGVFQGIVGLAQLAGKLMGMVSSALASVAGAAFGWASNIGSQIVSGVLSGVSNLGGALKDKVQGLIGSALSHIDIPFSSPVDHAAKKAIGDPIVKGALDGVRAGHGKLSDEVAKLVKVALERIRGKITRGKEILGSAFDNLSFYILKGFDRVTTIGADRIGSYFDKVMSNLEDSIGKERGVLDAFRDSLTPSEKMIADLERGRDVKRMQDALSSAKESLADATREGDASGILSAQKAIQDAEYDLMMDGLKAQAAAERAAKDTEYNEKLAALEASLKSQSEVIKANQDAQMLTYETGREIERRNLENHLQSLKNSWETGTATARKAMKAITNTIEGFGETFKLAGEQLGLDFARGLKDAKGPIAKAADELAHLVETYLKLRSPAEKGPLSKLDEWWKPLGDTLTGGVDFGSIGSAAAGMSGYGGSASSGRAVTINVMVSDQTISGMSTETKRKLARELAPEINRQIAIGV